MTESQAREMADESMVRNLAAQAEASGRRKSPVRPLPPARRGDRLDAGCGTGEISLRLAQMFPAPVCSAST
jgi:methylase of polypeptide subunit release factors